MGPLRRAWADDWFFPARFAGTHTEVVLDVIVRETGISPGILRRECQDRDAAYLASDLRVALERPGAHARLAAERLRGLEEVIPSAAGSPAPDDSSAGNGKLDKR